MECNFAAGAACSSIAIMDCHIFVKASVYPRCVTYEVRHIFESDWH